ncbi:MAG: beta-ketoacyl-ACP synthase III [Chlamydiota bacterium]
MKAPEKAKIISMGSYVPKSILTNTQLEQMVETSDEWILKRTGIKERRIAGKDEAASDMGTEAAKQALSKSPIPAEKIDYILVATMSPDYLSPATAAIIQKNLGLSHIPAIDIQAACTGFLYALSMAKAYVESGMYRNILVIATEKMSFVTDYTDRGTCILFGDGSSAAVISTEGSGLEINTITLGADGGQANLIIVPSGGSRSPATEETVKEQDHFVKLEGKEVFKHAVKRMAESGKICLENENLTIDDLAWVVPHQANLRIIDALAKHLNIPQEIIYKTVHKYGNTSASSIPMALTDLIEEKTIQPNDKFLLVAFGAGLTWGGAVLTQT